MLNFRSSARAEMTGAAPQPGCAAAAAIEDAKHSATEAAGKAGKRLRELREGASAAAGSGVQSLGDSATAAQARMNRYAKAAIRQVSEQPVKAALIAAAIGAGVTALLLAAARGRHRDDREPQPRRKR